MTLGRHLRPTALGVLMMTGVSLPSSPSRRFKTGESQRNATAPNAHGIQSPINPCEAIRGQTVCMTRPTAATFRSINFVNGRPRRWRSRSRKRRAAKTSPAYSWPEALIATYPSRTKARFYLSQIHLGPGSPLPHLDPCGVRASGRGLVHASAHDRILRKRISGVRYQGPEPLAPHL